MAEWLRLRVFEEKGLNIRRFCGGSNPAAKTKSIGWADGAEITSRGYYGWRRPNVWQQDGRVVRAPELSRRTD